MYLSVLLLFPFSQKALHYQSHAFPCKLSKDFFNRLRSFMRRRKRAILPFCLIRDGTREEVSWLNVRFAPDNLVTPWQKRAASNGPRPPLLLFCARV